MFQFPSNGKVCCESYIRKQERYCVTYQELPLLLRLTDRWIEARFQFPSNGKVCCKIPVPLFFRVSYHAGVSIPFKREGVLRASLTLDTNEFWSIRFQFPSNGKVCCERPLFALSGDAGSYTPKPYANCAVLFLSQNLPLKRYKPL